MNDEQVIQGTVELSATLNEDRCWPSHHDYQQASTSVFAGRAPLIYCRLCGDVVELKVQPQRPTITTEN